MGALLCDYRSRLSRNIRKLSKQEEPNINSLKPTGVDGAHWDMFVKKRLSGEFLVHFPFNTLIEYIQVIVCANNVISNAGEE